MRIVFFISAFISVIVLPWWLSVPILVALTIYFPFYLEVLPLAFIFDLLYSAKYNFPYTALSAALIFLFATMFVRIHIRT